MELKLQTESAQKHKEDTAVQSSMLRNSPVITKASGHTNATKIDLPD